MYMGIDQPWEDELATSIDDLVGILPQIVTEA
jgi:hypothetical protein